MKYSLRNLLKFSIRDLLWLTVVVALAVAWSLDRSRLRDEARAVEAERGLLEETVAAAKARAKFEAAILQAQAGAREAEAQLEKVQAAARSEVRGLWYDHLLGPPPNTPKP